MLETISQAQADTVTRYAGKLAVNGKTLVILDKETHLIPHARQLAPLIPQGVVAVSIIVVGHRIFPVLEMHRQERCAIETPTAVAAAKHLKLHAILQVPVLPLVGLILLQDPSRPSILAPRTGQLVRGVKLQRLTAGVDTDDRRVLYQKLVSKM